MSCFWLFSSLLEQNNGRGRSRTLSTPGLDSPVVHFICLPVCFPLPKIGNHLSSQVAHLELLSLTWTQLSLTKSSSSAQHALLRVHLHAGSDAEMRRRDWDNGLLGGYCYAVFPVAVAKKKTTNQMRSPLPYFHRCAGDRAVRDKSLPAGDDTSVKYWIAW